MSAVTAGTRWFSTTSSVEIIVVTGADVTLACGGEPLVDARPAETGTSATGDDLAVGKRYEDPESDLVVMVTRAGAGPLTADGRELARREAAPLPSSD